MSKNIYIYKYILEVSYSTLDYLTCRLLAIMETLRYLCFLDHQTI